MTMGNNVRLISFYLPQFHPILENNHWWGEGFTDWVNVRKAVPYFPGHYQPHVPLDLGYYDLRMPEVREAQAELAAEYGIYGFCYHHYWFGGRRLLERPFNEVLASSRPDFPFCLCWANENWTRRWDGQEHEILMRQQHSEEDHLNFIRDLFPAFRDKRYIRVNGKPLLIVYRTDIMPDPARTAEMWRDEAHKAGFDDLHLCRAETFTVYGDYIDPGKIGFDSSLEFPPHAIQSGRLHASVIPPESDFAGAVFDCEQVVLNSLLRPTPSYTCFRGVMPAWDNTPRRRNKGYIFANSSPELYELWLSECIAWTIREHVGDERLVFINAWNEWAEGCHLEPDIKYGYSYLEATRSALDAPSKLINDLESCLTADGSLDPDVAFRDLSTSLSDLRRVNLELTLQLRGCKTELQRLTGVTQLEPSLLLGDVSFRTWLRQYLKADRPEFRRTRNWLYYLLRAFSRATQKLGNVL